MSNELFDIGAYFKRIEYSGPTDVTIETLRGLHIAQVMKVPFENLDILNQKPISLEIDDLFKKIVTNKRGGYCFEMNGLFSFVLKKLGFQVKNLLARVWKDGFESSGKTHQVMLVEIDGQNWLCDVGFGGNGPVSPILLEEGFEQEDFMRRYQITRDPIYGYILQFKIKDVFQAVYAFTLDECYPQDYTIANYYTSTHPSSFFRQALICTKPTEDGRVTLFDHQLKIAGKESETEIAFDSDEEIQEALQNHFGIHEQFKSK